MRRTLIWFVSLLLLLLFLSCASRPRHAIIGVALTEVNHKAVELAAKQINESGGIDGVPLELMGLEWKVANVFNAQEILDWANKFAQTEDLLAVVGPSDSSSTLSAAAIYNQKGVPQIVTMATNPAITNIGDWTYRLCISDAAQGPALAEYSVRDWGKKRIAVLYVNDAYGRGAAERFEAGVRERGGEIVASIMHRNVLQPDDKEMIHSFLKGLEGKTQPDLVVLFQRAGQALWTVEAIRESAIKVEILGGDSLSPVSFLRLNPQLLEGMRISQFVSPEPENARAMKFVEDFREFAGADPDSGHALAYDAVYLAREAIAKGGYSRRGVKSYLDRLVQERSTVEGVGGDYSLGPDHDARRSLYIVEARNGNQHLLKTLPIP